MKHLLVVGLFMLSILAISMHHKVVKIDTKILYKNIWKIVDWISKLLLGAIIASWLR